MLDNKMIDFILRATQTVAQKIVDAAGYCKAFNATVVSNDGTTLTINIGTDTTNIPGIHYIAGQTITTGNKVVLLKLNNSPKSTDWICIKQS